MKTYTLGNKYGKCTTVRLHYHRQHIWHTSVIDVSARVARRIARTLGEDPYTNPRGHFGRAEKVFLEQSDR